MLSIPSTWPADTPDWWLPYRNIIQQSATDESADGKVEFLTTFDITAPTPADIPEAARCRMICYLIIGRLQGKALSDACESLMDLFSWQVEQARPASPIPEPKRHRASRVRQMERVPFVLSED